MSQPPGWDPYGQQNTKLRYTKRQRVPRAILGAAVAVIGITVAVVIALAGNGGHTVAAGQAAATPTSSASIAASPPHLAKTGSILVLSGDRAGEKMTITLVKVFRHPRPSSQVDVPRQGDRLYAVQFRFDNTGRVAYSNYPPNGAILDSAVGSYNSSRDHVTGCRSFVGTESIAVGSSELRCIVFVVPTTARITQVWFALASGTGAQAGLWQLRS